jgi:hypothetical protein
LLRRDHFGNFLLRYHLLIESSFQTVLLLSVLAAGILFDAGTAHAAQVTLDPLETRTRADLAVFTSWLGKYNAKGYIGEVGWPDNTNGDAGSWNQLANYWFSDADSANLWVTGWATGNWWGTTYRLSIYQHRLSGSGVDSPNSQAAIFEAHPTTAAYSRGVNVNGGEFGTGGSFGNTNPGTYGTNYTYDPTTTFSYLSSRGVRIVRLPFRWERIQPNLGGSLDPAELQRLKDVVSRAGSAGVKIILDLHNYGEYDSNGVRETVGQQVSSEQFANLWSQLSGQFKSSNDVIAYDLMNEPHDIGGDSPARSWESSSQAAVSIIRSNGDNKLIMVPGYNWSSVASWASTHPSPWINDPANNFRYEAHQYFDNDNSGVYASSYSSGVQNSVSRGYSSSQVDLPNQVVITSTTNSSSLKPGVPPPPSPPAKALSSPLPSMKSSSLPVQAVSSTNGSTTSTTVIPSVLQPTPLGKIVTSPLILAIAKYSFDLLLPVLFLLVGALVWLEYHLHYRKHPGLPDRPLPQEQSFM